MQLPTIKSSYNYRHAFAFLQDKGTELYGKNFRIYEEDHQVIIKLIALHRDIRIIIATIRLANGSFLGITVQLHNLDGSNWRRVQLGDISASG